MIGQSLRLYYAIGHERGTNMISQLLRMYYAIGERNQIFTRRGEILISTARTHTYTRLHNKRGKM